MKTALALLLLATLKVEHKGPHHRPVQLSVDFRAELNMGTAMKIDTVEMWPGVYLAQWEVVRMGEITRGEVLVNGPFKLAVADTVEFKPAPGVIAMRWPSVMEVAGR